MCGFAGILQGNKCLSSSTLDQESNVWKMLALMKHRGPDNSNIFTAKNAILGHNRLIIIDHSAKADQPMRDETGRFFLVFNGELYNFIELRERLKGLGYNFKTNSDTEVMLFAFMHWRESALEKFVGMFAGCFYDAKTRQAILFRDPFGQKPLYFKEIAGALSFASEIKPLLISAGNIHPNLESWKKYLWDAIYDDSAETMFEGVYQLLPGELFIVECGQIKTKKQWYHLTNRVRCSDLDYKDAAIELHNLLIDSAKIHMRSDVDIGVCLSGGLDSSILLSSIFELGSKNKSLKCLSVEFDNEFSEEFWIKSVAEQYNCDYEILNFSVLDFLSSLKPMMWHLEAPIGGLMNCAMSLVFRRAKELNIRVMQDGTGLDEAFGGYQLHHTAYLGWLKESDAASFDRAVDEYSENWGAVSSQTRESLKNYNPLHQASIDGTTPYRRDLLTFNNSQKSKAETLMKLSEVNPVTKLLMDYIMSKKIPRNTRMKDKLSMAYSIELRLPFLDHRVVEFGLSLHPNLMFKNGWSKSVLRQSVAGILSDDVRLASKRSIQAPQGKWLSSSVFNEYINDVLDSQTMRNTGLFDLPSCKLAFDAHCKSNAPNSFFIWQWINIYEWFEIFKNGDVLNDSYKLS